LIELQELLRRSAERHAHLCPRQVLGVRMGMMAGKCLNLQLPQTDKRLLTIAETDGCTLDGISVATGCWVGRRTLRVEDYGKVAATFIDTQTGNSIRIHPHPNSREAHVKYAPDAPDRWHAMLAAYQVMPDDQLFVVEQVQLTMRLEAILSRPEARARCEICGEEIFNEREVISNGRVLCRACAGEAYYHLRSEG
jgi:formylmethanofuran dehydrogenase subunit E